MKRRNGAASRTLWMAVALLAITRTLAAAQSSPQKPATPAPPPAQSPQVERDPKQIPPPPPAEAYSYRPEGRRDPFVSLLVRGPDARPTGKPADGVANLTVAEIVLKGILKSGGTYVALVQGPNTKTYIVRANERLVDGVIKAITEDSLIIVQDVNDPLSVTKQREVRKTLREL